MLHKMFVDEQFHVSFKKGEYIKCLSMNSFMFLLKRENIVECKNMVDLFYIPYLTTDALWLLNSTNWRS